MKILCVIILLIISVGGFCWWQNNSIVTSNYTIESGKIPSEFDDYKIVQISDLHNKDFGDKLIEKVINVQPDAIFITGDLIDAKTPDVEFVKDFLIQLSKVAPVYYTPGNHEAALGNFEEIVNQLAETGVIILCDEKYVITKDNSSINIIGLSDPKFTKIEQMIDTMSILSKNNDLFTILLSHRPEYFNLYAACGFDLVFSGHAHGGQFRIPFTHQGLFAPGQGCFPKYTEGMHTQDKTTLIISRGLGASSFPLRLFNRPELVVVTLKSVDK